MNDENDKPKNQTNEDDWAMTMPHKRLDETIEKENISDESVPKYNVPGQIPAEDDWGMTTPNINIQQNQPPTSDYDKTTPNINIQQNTWNEPNQPVESPIGQPADDWSMTAPNINTTNEDVNLKREEKRDEWVMPEPTFRVSSGKTGVFKLPEDAADFFDKSSSSMNFSVESTGEDISSDKTTPFFRISEEKSAEYEPQSAPGAVAPAAPSEVAASTAPMANQPAQVKKSSSKWPLILGGLFILFFLGTAALAAVYFMFLRQPEMTRVLPPMPEKSENVSLSNTSDSSSSSPSQTTTQPNLPQEINYKGTMLLISAGEFTMGSDTSDDEAAKPAHRVALPAFYIDKYEVTNGQYKEFCDATGRTPPPDPDFEQGYFLKRPNSPVMGVSFEDARAYAEWAGKRLPTEEEWEKAASWDEKQQAKRDFPWSNQFEIDKAAFNVTEPTDVGKFSGGASPYGVMDMAGNVLEWVDAFYQPYPNNTTANPEFGSKNRVVRGGYFDSKTSDRLKTTKRIYVPANFTADGQRTVYIGFRCAVSANDSRLKEVLQSK